MNHQPCGQSFDGMIAELKAESPKPIIDCKSNYTLTINGSMFSGHNYGDMIKVINQEVENIKRAAELRKKLGDDREEW